MKSQRICSIFVLSVSTVAVLASQEARRPPRGDSPVVVWVRSVTKDELRLSEKVAPALRSLVRRGVSFAALHPFTRQELIEHLRRIGKELGNQGNRYSEIDLGKDPESTRALAELATELGKPPPESKDEKAALRRLRKETNGGDDTSARKNSSKGSSPPLPDNETSSSTKHRDHDAEGESVSGRLTDALSAGNQLVLVLGFPPGPSIAPNEDTPLDKALGETAPESDSGEEKKKLLRRNATLEEIARTVWTFPGSQEGAVSSAVLLVVLIPENGSPALIASGHSLKKGRIFRDELDARDISAGVQKLLPFSTKATPHAAGDWITRTKLELKN